MIPSIRSLKNRQETQKAIRSVRAQKPTYLSEKKNNALANVISKKRYLAFTLDLGHLPHPEPRKSSVSASPDPVRSLFSSSRQPRQLR